MATGPLTRSDTNQSLFVFIKDPNTGVVKRVAIPSDLQVGLEGKPAGLDLFGSLSLNTTTYSVTNSGNNNNSGNIKIKPEDTVVSITTILGSPSAGVINAYLPANPSDGEIHFIKDTSGSAIVVPITVHAATGYTIDGATQQTISTSHGSLVVCWVKGNWVILISGGGGGGGGTITSVVGAGGTTATTVGSVVTVSSSAPPWNDIYGTGGTSVTVTGGQVNISSSIYADNYASYALVSGSSNSPPDSRLITQGNGITITDTGPGGEVVFGLFNPGTQLNNLTFLLPGLSSAGTYAVNCPLYSVVSATLGGSPDVTYAVSLRFRGVIEQKTYTGGYNDGSYFQIGGTPASDTYNVYSITVSDPSGTYYLNRGLSGQVTIYSFDYNKTIPIQGGATVTLFANSIDSTEIGNQTNTGGPLSIPGITSPSQPYDGQFIFVNYITSSILQTADIFVQNNDLLLSGTTYGVLDFVSGVYAVGFQPGVAQIGIDNNVIATLSGSTFKGPVTSKASVGGFTGSLTQTGITGDPFIIGQGAISVTTNSLGQVLISGSISADQFAAYALVVGDSKLTQARTISAGTNITLTDGGAGSTLTISSTGGGGSWSDSGHGLITTSSIYVSGSAIITGSLTTLGNLIASGGLTGSLQLTLQGNPYIIPLGAGISVTTNSLGQIVIGNTQQGDNKASYVVMGTTGSLSNDRVLTPGTGIAISDGGPGGSVFISATGQALSVAGGWTDSGAGLYTTSSVAIDPQGLTAQQVGSDLYHYVSGSHNAGNKTLFGGDVVSSGSINAILGLSGSHTVLYGGAAAFVGSGGTSVITGTQGQVIISSTIYTGPQRPPSDLYTLIDYRFNELSSSPGLFNHGSWGTGNATFGPVPTTITASFIQPAVSSSVVAFVASTSSYVTGTLVFIGGLGSGGYYYVNASGSNTITIENLGTAGINAPVGSTIPAGSTVTPKLDLLIFGSDVYLNEQGPFDYCYKFIGTYNANVTNWGVGGSTGGIGAFNNINQFSMHTLVKVDTYNATFSEYFGYSNNQNWSPNFACIEFQHTNTANGNWVFGNGNQTWGIVPTSQNSPPKSAYVGINDWTLLSLTVDLTKISGSSGAGALMMYKNGNLVLTGTITGPSSAVLSLGNTGYWFVGNPSGTGGDTGDNTYGNIALARFENTIRSQSYIQQMWASINGQTPWPRM